MDKNHELLVIGVIAVVAVGAFSTYFYVRSSGSESRYDQVWWIASDPHVGSHPGSPVQDLRIAVQDVNSLDMVDRAILMGDLVHESPHFRENFYSVMENLDVEEWYYTLGNHDYEGGSGKDNLLPTINKSIEVLGMKWLLISDMAGGFEEYSGGTLTEEVRNWATDEVVGSEKPVFIFAHQPPRQWDLYNEEFSSYIGGMKLRAWFFGHIHEWRASWVDNKMLSFSDRSIDWAEHRNGVFMFLEKEGGTVDVTLRFRDHENGSWIEIPHPGNPIENIHFSVDVS